MSQQQTQLKKIKKIFEQYCQNLIKKIQNPQQKINLQMKQCSQYVSAFFDQATNITRTKFAYIIQKQIRIYLKTCIFDRCNSLLTNNQSDQLQFIYQLSDIWENYQRFIYALNFVLHRTTNTFNDFHRLSRTHQPVLLQQQKKDGIDQNYKNQVTPIVTMSLSQLKQFLQLNKMLQPLLNTFTSYFHNLIKKQRQTTQKPTQQINKVLQFFQSMYYGYDSQVQRIQGKLRIIKKHNIYAPITRKSTSHTFFASSFKPKLQADCSTFYKQWVDNKALSLNSAQQLKQILNFLQQQQVRAKFYIHDFSNYKSYIDTVQQNLISYKFQQRIFKTTGMKYFLNHFSIQKSDMIEQINDLWKVYKRVYNKQDKRILILKVYQNFLKQQATNISKLTQKPPQFIQNSIKFNKKNLQLIQLFSKSLQFDRLRKQILQQLLQLKYLSKPNIKQNVSSKHSEYFGAKHWAGYLNMKLRNKYLKVQKYGQTQIDLMNLFKLIICTNYAITEHCRLLNSRLLDDIDMSLTTQYSNALQLQQNILQQIKKQTSQSDIKSIQNCLKDIRNSFQQRQKQKQRLSNFNFFNQLIKKSGNHWVDTILYDIQPPLILRSCINQLRQQFQSSNFAFQLQNGTSTFTATYNKQLYKFQFKNIYLMVLLVLDQQPQKKIFFTDLIKCIQPIGSEKTHNQFIKIIIQLQKFGLVLTNKSLSPQHISQVWSWSPSDYLQLNKSFIPQKKLPFYKTANLTSLPQYIRKAFQQKLSTIQQQYRDMQKNRKTRVQSKCVQLLKFAQTNDSKGGKGVITFDDLLTELNKSNRQDNVNAMYLKQILQQLINRQYCQRVQDKRNVFRYIT